MQKEAVIHSMPGDRLLEAHDTSSCPNNRGVSKPRIRKREPSRVPLSQSLMFAPPRPEPAQRAPGAGGALVSHRVAPAVPSALAGLTSGFGMGPGVPRPPWPPAPGGRCGAGCLGEAALQGALGAAQRSRKPLVENGRERRGRCVCPEGLGRLVAPG